MSKKPTIILVHGAWHQPAHFDTVVAKLRGAGFEAVTPKLPSVGLSSDPGDALYLDAAAVRDALNDVVDRKGNDAMLVMHSYGGLAGTEGYGMLQEGRKSDSSRPSSQVRRLVYLAAHGACERGDVHRADLNLPYLSLDRKGIITHIKSYERFYEGDCTREEAQPAIDLCLPMAASAMTSPTKYEAWREHGTPCTYIKCMNDRAVTPAMCDVYIARMRDAGVDVEVETMACGHSPAHVAPGELADLIEKIAARS